MKAKLKDKSQLRTGYTTGACAAAAAKAAVSALLTQEPVKQVEISLPAGQQALFAIKNCIFDSDKASCSVIKDAGDDPDITDRAEIQAEAQWGSRPGITVHGGRGVGVVTKPGLEVPVGMPAINAVPAQMIIQSVSEAIESILYKASAKRPNPSESSLPIVGEIRVRGLIIDGISPSPRIKACPVPDTGYGASSNLSRQGRGILIHNFEGSYLNGKGLEITISVPDGERLAKRTLNPRLGIAGGISILGTSGIVIPYSVNAYTACISQALDIAAASGCKEVVLTTGRRSERFAQKELALPEECFIQAGDFIGYSLDECARKGLTKAVVWGMIGKISKLAASHLYTNISDGRVDIALMTGLAADCGVPDDLIKVLKGAVTANHFRKLMPHEYIKPFCDRLCLVAARKCAERASGKVKVECIVTDPEGMMLGRASFK